MMLVLVAGTLLALGQPHIPPQASDSGLGALVRDLVRDSLAGGGRRDDLVHVAADSATEALLRRAGLAPAPRAAGRELACPGSTGEGGARLDMPVGYVVTLELELRPGDGAGLVRGTAGCTFVHRGRPGASQERAEWEVRLEGGRWQVARTRWHTMT